MSRYWEETDRGWEREEGVHKLLCYRKGFWRFSVDGIEQEKFAPVSLNRRDTLVHVKRNAIAAARRMDGVGPPARGTAKAEDSKRVRRSHDGALKAMIQAAKATRRGPA